MPNPSCPECGPQGGHGRPTLAFSVVDCSLCDGTAPRGIAKHVSSDTQGDLQTVPSLLTQGYLTHLWQQHNGLSLALPVSGSCVEGHNQIKWRFDGLEWVQEEPALS